MYLWCSFRSFSPVQLLSRVWLFAIAWTAARQASLSITNCWSLPKPMSLESVMPSNRLILCRPLLLLPSIFPSIRVFSNESTLRMRWPKYWNFSFKITPSNEYSGLISFRMDWLDLLAVQGTLKSLLQHHSSKASILQHSAFFLVQLFYLWQFAVKISKNILAPEMGFSCSFSLCMSLKVLLIFFFHTPWNFHIRFFWAIALSISITNPERQLSNLSYPKYQKQAVEKFVTKTVNHWPI